MHKKIMHKFTNLDTIRALRIIALSGGKYQTDEFIGYTFSSKERGKSFVYQAIRKGLIEKCEIQQRNRNYRAVRLTPAGHDFITPYLHRPQKSTAPECKHYKVDPASLGGVR
jgi:hypothetical protein